MSGAHFSKDSLAKVLQIYGNRPSNRPSSRSPIRHMSNNNAYVQKELLNSAALPASKWQQRKHIEIVNKVSPLLVWFMLHHDGERALHCIGGFQTCQ